MLSWDEAIRRMYASEDPEAVIEEVRSLGGERNENLAAILAGDLEETRWEFEQMLTNPVPYDERTRRFKEKLPELPEEEAW